MTSEFAAGPILKRFEKRLRASTLTSIAAFYLAFGASAFAQGSAGIPVNDPLVIKKCSGCHTRDDRGNMLRISYVRTTPEAWGDTLKRMVLAHGVQLDPVEARAIVKYLSTEHGLAPEEAKPVMYDAERRIHEETNVPSDAVRDACTKCHAFARALSWRRSVEDWTMFADAHAATYKVPAPAHKEAVAYLTKMAPLHTPEWDAWSAKSHAVSLAGRWIVTASTRGRGTFYGEMQIDPAGDDEYTTRVVLKSVKDGSSVVRVGRIAVYGGSAWRGRSKGNDEIAGPASGTPNAAPGDLGSDAREVLSIAADQRTAEGRWFWGQYQEFGFDVKMRRPFDGPTLLSLDRTALKIGSKGNRIHVFGNNFPVAVTAADVDFGAGTKVVSMGMHSGREIVLDVDVAADAKVGPREVTLRGSPIPTSVAIYDRVDYLTVSPESSLAAFGDSTRPRGYQQFDTVGYQRGPDGRLHTADDIPLGPVDVTWSMEVFYADEGSDPAKVGKISPAGFFTPAQANAKANFDVWAVATAKSEVDSAGKPLVGKGYLVVTIPSYTFAGHRYVRDLDRWVDDGPAESGK